MPFKHHPRPNIHDWVPDDTFDQENDRIMVYTTWGDKLVLAWSSNEPSTGGFIVAPEAMPDNFQYHFGDKLEPYEYAPGKFSQPMLYVYQQEDNTLKVELAHPGYTGSFRTSGQVYRTHAVRRGQRRHSTDVAGHSRAVLGRSRDE